LTFAWRTRGDTEANVKSAALPILWQKRHEVVGF
jgi:hypothetical protein